MNIELSSTGAAYIRYGTSASVEDIYVGGDESSDVIVDLDDRGTVIGIEIVDVSIAEDVARARAFAAERDLPFPRDLAAAVRDVAAAKARAIGGMQPDFAHCESRTVGAVRKRQIFAKALAGTDDAE